MKKIRWQTKDGAVKYFEDGEVVCDDAALKEHLETLKSLWEIEVSPRELHASHLTAAGHFGGWLMMKHGFDIEFFREERKPYPKALY